MNVNIYIYWLKFNFKKILFLFFLIFLIFPKESFAYYTNMPASVVIGQTDFVSSNINTTASTLGPTGGNYSMIVDINGRLFIANALAHRVLIWNKVPTTNGQPADMVLGQPDLVTGTFNNGGISSSTLSGPNRVISDGTHLFVADAGNNRVLIWNSLPTTNQQPADVVVGQTSMKDTSTNCDNIHFKTTYGITTYRGKLIVSTATGPGVNRILIWNTIPTTNGQPADVVLGQPDMNTCGLSATAANTFNRPREVMVDSKGKLYLADDLNHRILVWNSIPTTTTTNTDLVIGQTSFTASTASTTASGFNNFSGLLVSTNRLFVAEATNSRILIFNSIPTSNGGTADLVLGHSTFTSSTLNEGGLSATSMN